MFFKDATKRFQNRAKELIQKLSDELGYPADEKELASQRTAQECLAKVTDRRDAEMLKKHTSMTNEWIANRLQMGHPAGVRMATALYRTNKSKVGA